MSGYRLTRAADQDIEAILRDSGRMFGPLQQSQYAELIEAAASMVAEDPLRPGSRQRGELTADLRSFHIDLAADRQGAASHILYYLPDQDGTVIVRVLHHSMDPSLHLGG